jgi:hypothetical protein
MNNKNKGGFLYDNEFISWENAGNNYRTNKENKSIKERSPLQAVLVASISLLIFAVCLTNANQSCKISYNSNCQMIQELSLLLIGN